MTVCIAAICNLRPGTTGEIILCTDGKGSSALGSKEFTLKERLLTFDWRCLTAGNDDELTALLPIFKRRLGALAEVDETNIVPALRAALQERKIEKANEFTQGKWGLAYEDFRKSRSQFPEDQFRADMQRIAAISIDADCIVAGFLSDGEPMLLQTDPEGGVKIREDFAVSGEGAYLAQSVLMHREMYSQRSRAWALYCVYEAKKYAERVASVGKNTFLTTWLRGEGTSIVNDAGKTFLEQQFSKFGPQEVSGELTLPPAYFTKL